MSNDQMNTTIHVTSVSDVSGVDRMLAKIKALQATVAKMTNSRATGLTDSLEASVKKARDLGSVLARNEQETAANLRRRLGMERRIWAQSARETEKNAKAEIAASGRVAAAKAKDSAQVDRAARRDEAMRFASGARDLRARILGDKLAALEQTKATAATAKAAERALVARFDFEGRMRRQRTREEAATARETANARREASRIETSAIAERERVRAAEMRRRTSAWSNVRSGASTAATRGREAFSQTGQIARSAMVVPAAAIGASVRGIAGRMQVDAAETSLKIFGDDSGKKFTSKRIAEIRKDWLDSAALETGNTSTDGLKAFTEINKAGIRSPKENTQLLLKAGAGLEIDTGATAKLMGLVDRNLGAASTPKRMQSVLNSIAVAAREDPTNAPEIIEGMKRGFGALSLGNMSPEHLAGLVSGAQSVGVQPGKAGTFISTLMKDLTAGTYAKGQRGKDLNEAARMLGFGSAKSMASSAASDSTKTIIRVLERLEAMPELQRSKVTNRLSQTQWSDEDLSLLQGLGGLKKTLSEIDNPKNANFLNDASNERMNSWEKQWARSKAIFGRFWESIGVGFDVIFNEVNRYFYDSAKRYDFSRITNHVKSFLGGFVEGLGFKDVRSLLESILGKPGETGQDRIEAFKAFGKGLAEGLRSIFEAAKSLMSAFTGGSSNPEVIGRLTGRIVGLSAALLVLSPVITVLGALAAGITAIAAALRVGKGVIDLITKPPGAKVPVPEGAGAAPKGAGPVVKGATGPGLIGGGAAILGLPIDPSKADKDRLMNRLGNWAIEQERAAQERTRTRVEPPAKVEKQSALDDDIRRFIRPASLHDGDVVRGVDRIAHAVDGLSARIQLAAISGAGPLAGSGAARAVAGSSGAGAAGLGEIRGSGGPGALLGAIPGQALPGTGTGPRGIIGGGNGSDTASPDQKSGGSRSWRNNNPGNIEDGPFARSMGAVGTDGRFAKFPSYEAGRKAQEKLLFESKGYRDLTLGQAIRRWAPASENNLTAYIAAMGGDGSKRMSEYSPEQRAKLLDAMQKHEGWKEGTVTGGQSGPGNVQIPGGNPADAAARFLGMGERNEGRGALEKFTGGNIVGSANAWCARFVNASLAAVGQKGSGSAVANSFLRWGKEISADMAEKGDVLVRHNGRGVDRTGGHVGMATGRREVRNGRLMLEMIQGNSGSDDVRTTWEDASKLAVRRSTERAAVRDAERTADKANGKPLDIGGGMTSTGWKKTGDRANNLADRMTGDQAKALLADPNLMTNMRKPGEYKAGDLVERSEGDTQAQRLARSAPKFPQAGGVAGGTKINAPINIQHIGDAKGTANAVQRHIQDVSGYHTQDRAYESI